MTKEYENYRTAETQSVVPHSSLDKNQWDCIGNNVSSGLCSSNVISYIESLGKKVVINGTDVSIQ